MESHCTALLIQKSTDEAGRNVFHVAAAIDDYIYVKMVSDEGRKVVGLIETMFEATESENKLSPLQVGMVFFFFFLSKNPQLWTYSLKKELRILQNKTRKFSLCYDL